MSGAAPPPETSAGVIAVAAASMADRRGQKMPGEVVARDVMIHDPSRAACDATLVEVAGVMRSLLVAFPPVCDTSGALHGIVGLLDLQRAARGGHPAAATAATVAREPAVTIRVDDPVDGCGM